MHDYRFFVQIQNARVKNQRIDFCSSSKNALFLARLNKRKQPSKKSTQPLRPTSEHPWIQRITKGGKGLGDFAVTGIGSYLKERLDFSERLDNLHAVKVKQLEEFYKLPPFYDKN